MQVNKIISLALVASLAGCASLPTNGPTGKQIAKSVADPEAALPIRLVELSTIEHMPKLQGQDRHFPELAPPPTDMVGPGDILDITIYEAGVTLFAGGMSGAGSLGGQAAAISPGVQAQKLPASRVSDEGDIVIPYGGRLHVVGRTVSEVEGLIRASLRRVSQNPQVSVTVSQAITNTVIVGGEVMKPGRLVLNTNRESLSDIIALAGGYRGNARDLTLRVTRRNETMDVRLASLVDDPSLDVRAYPGDRFTIINNPLTFSVLGASGRVDQLPFSASRMSLAEAIAASGGTNPNAGDPGALFVFRYTDDGQGAKTPVVYHINMMKASSYFLAQRFMMEDKDVLYFGSAAANQPSKLFQLISQLFTPLMTVTAAVQTVNNSNN